MSAAALNHSPLAAEPCIARRAGGVCPVRRHHHQRHRDDEHEADADHDAVGGRDPSDCQHHQIAHASPPARVSCYCSGLRPRRSVFFPGIHKNLPLLFETPKRPQGGDRQRSSHVLPWRKEHLQIAIETGLHALREGQG